MELFHFTKKEINLDKLFHGNPLEDESVNNKIGDEIAQKGNTSDENMTIGKEGKIKDIGSWYYNAPSIIILLIALYIIMGRKRE